MADQEQAAAKSAAETREFCKGLRLKSEVMLALAGGAPSREWCQDVSRDLLQAAQVIEGAMAGLEAIADIQARGQELENRIDETLDRLEVN